MFQNLMDYFKHKKTKAFFFTVLIDIIIVMLGVPMTEVLILLVTGLGGAQILGQSLSDGLSKGATAVKTKAETEDS